MSVNKKILSSTGWLLVVVYLGALTAISGFIARWIVFSKELAYYEVFFEVMVSAGVLYLLARIYKTLSNKDSDSRWWERGLKILAVVFGLMGFTTFVLGYGLLSSIEEAQSEAEFQSRTQEEQDFIILGSYTFGILFLASSILAIIATIGLPLHRRIGWYAAVSLILVQIVSVTGLLDKERATYFIMPPVISKNFDASQVLQVETVFVPIIMNGVFGMIVANVVMVTFLTLPRILSKFRMPTNLLSTRITKGH